MTNQDQLISTEELHEILQMVQFLKEYDGTVNFVITAYDVNDDILGVVTDEGLIV